MVARSSMAVLARRNRSPRLEDVVTTLLASRDRRVVHWPASATREAIAAAAPTPAVIMISRPLKDQPAQYVGDRVAHQAYGPSGTTTEATPRPVDTAPARAATTNRPAALPAWKDLYAVRAA